MDSLLKSKEALITTHNLSIADRLKLLNNLKLNFTSHSRNIRRKKERKEGKMEGREGGREG